MSTSDPTPIISIRNVTKRFSGTVALKNVSLDILPGEFHSIAGENGAGKSTLMKILSGVYSEYEGEILLHNQSIRFNTTRDAEEAGIQIIHQELNLVEELTVAANVFLGREIKNWLGLLDDRKMEATAAELLEELVECEIHPRTLAGELRVGDQQLIEIAKALSQRAEILIMDEPTSALTETEVARLDRVIARLRERGVTILYISHKMDEIFRLSDRITVLRDGELVKTLNCSETDVKEITKLMVGREIESVSFGDSPRTPGEEILRIENLSLPWPGHARPWRLRNISFSLKRGEILGIAGLMGAGRTELLECLFGASDTSPQGKIYLDGKPVYFHHPAEAQAAGIALVTEDRKRLGIFAQMSVGENISMCNLKSTRQFGLIRSDREREMNQACIEQLRVKTSNMENGITSLSGGNQQKALIGRWLLTKPNVLLLDDPTRGIDVGAKAELYQLMDKLCRDGLGILLTSSELPELLTVCDRILVLCEGHMTGEFTQAEANEEKIMEAATMRECLVE